MNKNYISWIHYAYITITATVLAYVTVMDSPNDGSIEGESAVSMLPSITEPEPEPEPEPSLISSLISSSEPVVAEQLETPPIVVAEPIDQQPPGVDNPKGGKLKKSTTKYKKYKQKRNKTRSQK